MRAAEWWAGVGDGHNGGAVRDFVLERAIDIEPLECVRTLDGSLEIDPDFDGELRWLENLEEITGDLGLWRFERLDQPSIFDQLASVGGDLSFSYHYGSFNAFNALVTVGGAVRISGSHIERMEVLASLESAGSIEISGLGHFGEVVGLDNLTHVEHGLNLHGGGNWSPSPGFPNSERWVGV